MAKYVSTKTYGHNVGLSSAFRQWRADSHCRHLHGYAIKVRFEFESDELDIRNWVVDFGSLKSLKGWLENTFDHKCLVAEDDPHMDWFEEAHRRGIIDMVKVPATGCEKFAEMIFEATEVWLQDNGYAPRVRLRRVEISEHGANSAIFER
jgi:6-pyruvoyltetrahydropterin/6-carboxytetrahydropterin synthase